MRKPTVDWLAGLAAVGAQWRACTAATRRRSRVGLVSGGSAWATSALCKLCMMGPVLMLHGLVLLLADGTVPEPPGMARVTGGELNLKYTPESGMLFVKPEGGVWPATMYEFQSRFPPELPAPGTNGDLQKHVPCAK